MDRVGRLLSIVYYHILVYFYIHILEISRLENIVQSRFLGISNHFGLIDALNVNKTSEISYSSIMFMFDAYIDLFDQLQCIVIAETCANRNCNSFRSHRWSSNREL